jgi:hypothetical protein
MMLSRGLAIFSPAPDPVAEARQRLREKQSAKYEAEKALGAAKARTTRVRDLAHAVSAADAEVDAAELDARGATRSWATTGAAGDAFACSSALLERLERARRAASDARTMAAGADQALPALRQAEDEAQYQVRRAEGELSAAVSAVLAASLEPNFARAARAVAAYREAMLPLCAGALLFKPWGKAHALAGFSSPDFSRRVSELAFRDFDPAELEELAERFAKLGRRLATDPDAEPT